MGPTGELGPTGPSGITEIYWNQSTDNVSLSPGSPSGTPVTVLSVTVPGAEGTIYRLDAMVDVDMDMPNPSGANIAYTVVLRLLRNGAPLVQHSTRLRLTNEDGASTQSEVPNLTWVDTTANDDTEITYTVEIQVNGDPTVATAGTRSLLATAFTAPML